jgi:hypothetical protein
MTSRLRNELCPPFRPPLDAAKQATENNFIVRSVHKKGFVTAGARREGPNCIGMRYASLDGDASEISGTRAFRRNFDVQSL